MVPRKCHSIKSVSPLKPRVTGPQRPQLWGSWEKRQLRCDFIPPKRPPFGPLLTVSSVQGKPPGKPSSRTIKNLNQLLALLGLSDIRIKSLFSFYSNQRSFLAGCQVLSRNVSQGLTEAEVWANLNQFMLWVKFIWNLVVWWVYLLNVPHFSFPGLKLYKELYIKSTSGANLKSSAQSEATSVHEYKAHTRMILLPTMRAEKNLNIF